MPPRDQISLARGAINYREEINPGESGDLLSPYGKTGVDQKPLVGLIHEYVGRVRNTAAVDQLATRQ